METKKHSHQSQMTHEYQVSGMSCMGCQHHVKESLEQVEGVKKVAIDLASGRAEIRMLRLTP